MIDFKEIEDQLILVPSGTIQLRDDRTNRIWSEQIQSFYLARFPVTQEMYFDVTAIRPSAVKGTGYPVESVSWVDAVVFCNKLSILCGLSEFYQIAEGNTVEKLTSNGFRLPTEAEWEYACRAGTQGPRYSELEEIAWYSENSNGHPQPVGNKKANNWGFHDMLGNVWEWCSDLYDPEVYGDYRIFRGGGWADGPRGCLATNRRRGHPTFKIDDLGFRVARSSN